MMSNWESQSVSKRYTVTGVYTLKKWWNQVSKKKVYIIQKNSERGTIFQVELVGYSANGWKREVLEDYSGYKFALVRSKQLRKRHNIH